MIYEYIFNAIFTQMPLDAPHIFDTFILEIFLWPNIVREARESLLEISSNTNEQKRHRADKMESLLTYCQHILVILRRKQIQTISMVCRATREWSAWLVLYTVYDMSRHRAWYLFICNGVYILFCMHELCPRNIFSDA